MTTGRINQVATSRAALRQPRCRRARRAVSPPRGPTAPTVPAQRAECFRAHNRSMMIRCRQSSAAESPARALRPQRTSRSASCCLLAVFLERCCPTAAGRAPPVRAKARGASAGAGGKSAFGARCAQLHSLGRLKPPPVVAAAFSRDRCGVNAGHCLRTRCFLRRPRSTRDGGSTQ